MKNARKQSNMKVPMITLRKKQISEAVNEMFSLESLIGKQVVNDHQKYSQRNDRQSGQWL